MVFEVEKSTEDVKFAVRRPRDRIRRFFLAGKHNFLKMVAYPATWSSDMKFDTTKRLTDPENLLRVLYLCNEPHAAYNTSLITHVHIICYIHLTLTQTNSL